MKLFVKNIFLGTITWILFVTVSCSDKVSFLSSSVVPSAEGSVKIKKDHNHNYTINFNVTHLVKPSKLDPPKAAYIVWMETDTSGLHNLGQLKSYHGLFTNARTSSLHTITSLKPTGFFVTAEEDIETKFPGTIVALKSIPVSIH